MRTAVEVKVPASTANLGPGFDTLGMAFQLYTTIRVELAAEPSVTLYGDQLEGLPTDASNLVYQMVEKVYQLAEIDAPSFAIHMKSDIPLTRGLGSSAAAIVGGLVAGNMLAGEPFTKEQLLYYATKLEGHPDNVGASLYGGIVVAVMAESEVPCIKIDPKQDLKAVVVIPDFMLSTEKARGVLPQQYSKQDAIHALSHASLLVAALATGQYDYLQKAMKDRIHQPYRMALVPGMEELLAGATEHGALGAALSGAGPTVIALACGDEANLKQYMLDTLARHGVKANALTLLPDLHGVEVIDYIDTTF